MVMKALMVVIDGMSDRPIREHGNRTPVELAEIPNMDRIACEGLCGLMLPLDVGKRVGSDTAHLAILGYDPYSVYTGRGPIECAGAGLKLKEGDICLRCNYANVEKDEDGNFVVNSRTADQISDTGDLEAFETALNSAAAEIGGAEIIFKNSQGYRCVLVLRGDDLSPAVSDADPHCDEILVKEVVPEDGSQEAKNTAKILNSFIKKSYSVLNKHPANLKRCQEGKLPANLIIPRGAGCPPSVESFYERWELKGSVVAGTGLIKGLGKIMGMNVVDVPGATGYVDTDFIAKAKAAVREIEKNDCDFVLLHIEGTDEVSHDRDLWSKVTALEKADDMLGYIMGEIEGREILLVVLSDHTTSTELGDHTADPAPIVLWNGKFVPDLVSKFTEQEIYSGGLHRIFGKDIIPLILDQTDRAHKFGA